MLFSAAPLMTTPSLLGAVVIPSGYVPIRLPTTLLPSVRTPSMTMPGSDSSPL